MKKLIAVTGGIGSGKSKVLEIVNSLGYTPLSCDNVTKQLYKKQGVLRKIKKIIPQGVTGKLYLKPDKLRIAKVVFSDQKKYAEFTGFLTTLTLKKTLKIASKLKGLVFVEVPLLFEFCAESYFDQIIVVTRNKNARIESVKIRSGLTDQQVIERIKSQYDYDNSDLSNYLVITNNGSLDDLQQQTIAILKQINTDLG